MSTVESYNHILFQLIYFVFVYGVSQLKVSITLQHLVVA